jgi:hypothetical protein
MRLKKKKTAKRQRKKWEKAAKWREKRGKGDEKAG